MGLVDIVIAINSSTLLGAGVLLALIWWYCRPERYALFWSATLILSAVGWALGVVARPQEGILFILTGMIADLCFLIGYWLFALGTARYFGGPALSRYWLLGASAAVGIGWVVMVRGSPALQEVMSAVSVAVLLLPATARLWVQGRRNAGEVMQAVSVTMIALLNAAYALSMLVEQPAYVREFDLTGQEWLAIAVPVTFTLFAMSGVLVTCLRLLERMGEQARALERSIEETQLATRAKSEFFATVSHEIRTPVNAILGSLDILGTTALDEHQTRCISVMDSAGQSLLALLDDILDMTRIEAGRLTLETGDVDLHRRLRDVVELMTPPAVEKGLSIGLEIAPGVPRHVRGDPVRLRQILLNLIGNAIKFTERGSITVTAAPTGTDADGRTLVRLTVADTGIGIPAERLATIFEAFSQADGSISRRFGGAGLGLTICRRLAALMDGRIEAESEPGRGSRFHVEIPFAPGVPVAGTGPVEEALPVWTAPPTVLLVEDEAVNRFVASQILERHGFRVVQVESGPKALELLARERVDIILMDLGMPGMDGLEVATRIRAMDGPAATTPIVALTASVLTETVSRCREAGMQGFVSKPIRIDVLLHKLAEVIPPAAGDGLPAADGGHEIPRPQTALPAGRLEALRRELGDAAVDTMLTRAHESLTEGRAALAAAWERRARRRVVEIAHRLAGTLDVMGLGDAAGSARRLEEAAEVGASLHLDPFVEELLATLDGVLATLPRPAATLAG
ncbi:ATP-binding protein [Rhodocista pekingensis]|uniref:histidine kinase n=1 Tax=Rhodocista pekingensis TaxID=201185 RepID=A0ABW2KWG9_9PROT